MAIERAQLEETLQKIERGIALPPFESIRRRARSRRRRLHASVGVGFTLVMLAVLLVSPRMLDLRHSRGPSSYAASPAGSNSLCNADVIGATSHRIHDRRLGLSGLIAVAPALPSSRPSLGPTEAYQAYLRSARGPSREQAPALQLRYGLFSHIGLDFAGALGAWHSTPAWIVSVCSSTSVGPWFESRTAEPSTAVVTLDPSTGALLTALYRNSREVIVTGAPGNGGASDRMKRSCGAGSDMVLPRQVRKLSTGAIFYDFSLGGSRNTVAQPPPGFDPLRATQSELTLYRLPTRPSGGAALKSWAEAMTAYRHSPPFAGVLCTVRGLRFTTENH